MYVINFFNFNIINIALQTALFLIYNEKIFINSIEIHLLKKFPKETNKYAGIK
jgi:hypothetical protein